MSAAIRRSLARAASLSRDESVAKYTDASWIGLRGARYPATATVDLVPSLPRAVTARRALGPSSAGTVHDVRCVAQTGLPARRATYPVALGEAAHATAVERLVAGRLTGVTGASRDTTTRPAITAHAPARAARPGCGVPPATPRRAGRSQPPARRWRWSPAA